MTDRNEKKYKRAGWVVQTRQQFVNGRYTVWLNLQHSMAQFKYLAIQRAANIGCDYYGWRDEGTARLVRVYVEATQ